MSGWQLNEDAPTAYTRFAAAIMEPWTDDLIVHARCKADDRVLDVACGAGLVASRVNSASQVQCWITGIDINEPMLAVAKRDTSIAWHLGSALELPFAEGSFEVVLCQQGLQYFPDRTLAMREMARVLVPGGRLSLNVWGAMRRQVFHTALVEAIGTYLGTEATKAFDLAFSLHTVGELRTLANDAGLKDIKVRFEHRTIRHPDPSTLGMGFMQATPLAGQFLALSNDARLAFGAQVGSKLQDYVDDAGMAAPMENHFLTATR
jgi:ubiquinone/menaquinone biosynthesis C-methylase UbiE